MKTNWTSTKQGYGILAKFFHWLMLVIIVATYVTMDIKSFFPKGSQSRELIPILHYILGLSVLGLIGFRLGVRLAGATPEVKPTMPAWQEQLAKGMHWVLYAMLIILPVLGWLTLSAKGKPVLILGAELPALIDKSQELAKLFKEFHETIATVGYFLLGVHVVVALYHHYFRKDNTLKLMLPSR